MIRKPIVALESTVITHGLPRPKNRVLAEKLETIVADQGATPATIAILDGKIKVGVTADEINELAFIENPLKISIRDISTALFLKKSGGTTVAATMFLAHKEGIAVFSTGGIGGVHDLNTMDISADLQALSSIPMIVVCAGAKAILDLPKTIEYLETMSVPVVGYQTDEFPAFYSRSSGLPVSVRLNTPEEIAAYALQHWKQGLHSSILVCQPLPEIDEIPNDIADKLIQVCQEEAHNKGITGQAITPFLLGRLASLSNGQTLNANLKLLYNNAELAGKIAVVYHQKNIKSKTI